MANRLRPVVVALVFSGFTGCSLFTDFDDLSSGAAFSPDAAASADAASADGAPDATYRQVVLSDGPVAYYRLGDTDDVAKDEVGGHDGAYKGAITHAKGALAEGDDGAAVFDGASFVDLDNTFPFLETAPFSIEAWLALASGSNESFCAVAKNSAPSSNDAPSDGYAMYTYGSPSRVRMSRWRNGTEEDAVGSSILPGGTFVHIVGTYDGATLSVYANGELDSTTPSRRRLTSIVDTLTIGASRGGAGCHFIGAIDEVAIYDKPLSAERIRAHHRAGLGQ